MKGERNRIAGGQQIILKGQVALGVTTIKDTAVAEPTLTVECHQVFPGAAGTPAIVGEEATVLNIGTNFLHRRVSK
jgi:hypothetical protein